MPGIGDLAGQLLTLDIHTIVSDGIVAEPMPADGEALIRIARMYKDFLSRVIEETEAAGSDVTGLPSFVREDGTPVTFEGWNVRTGGLRTFGALQRGVQACQRARAAAPQPHGLRAEHDAVLARIGGACGDIRAILRRMGLGDSALAQPDVEWAEETGVAWPAFDREAVLTLRRIWETGVDVIVMLTSVRLDGSVTTRVLDGWTTPDAAPVYDLHYRAVDIALARWSFLVQTAQQMAGFFFRGDPGGTALPSSAGGALAALGQASVPAASPGDRAGPGSAR